MAKQQKNKADFKVEVLISKELQQQIYITNYLCKEGDEWSGLLIYKVLEGDINNLEKLKIECAGFYPMDHGTAAFTTFSANPDWFKCFAKFPQVDPMNPQPGWFIGKIHSHNKMAVFHSTTDETDLKESAENFPMFLSLIVNYACRSDCKLAIAYETEREIKVKKKWRLKGLLDWEEQGEEKVENPKEILVIDCDVRLVGEGWLIDQNIELAKPKPIVQTPQSNSHLLMSTNTDKKKGNKEVPKWMYAKMMDNFSDLVTLGVHINEKPFTALQYVDRELIPSNIEAYKKALTLYFPEWVDLTYKGNPNILITEVVECIENFLSYHKTMWWPKQIIPMLDGLTKEYYRLRKIQRGSMVQQP